MTTTITWYRLRKLAFLVLMASPLLAMTGCSNEPTGVDPEEDCQEVGLLMICGADTTRVDESGD